MRRIRGGFGALGDLHQMNPRGFAGFVLDLGYNVGSEVAPETLLSDFVGGVAKGFAVQATLDGTHRDDMVLAKFATGRANLVAISDPRSISIDLPFEVFVVVAFDINEAIEA